VLVLLITGTYAQTNKLYWKNRKPYEGYWQQDVAYTIDAAIDENMNQLKAAELLVYTNNSPDTLQFVYFHLFQNAFVKGSYTHQLERANNTISRLGRYEAAGLGTVIEGLKVNGTEAETELDNTILKVLLPEPLLPGGSVTFSMDFTTYFDRGGTRRRMQMYDAWGFMHYNGCQWFPKICVYDAKFGWDTHQHLGKEFYGDFGSYDVTLEFAANYIVEATGALQNREEVLPDELRRKLDIKNFADKPWNEKPSVIIPYNKDERKKWHFKAENVHDFAFTADPSYRIATIYQDGVECVAIVQEPHASGWQDGAQLVAKTIKTFSEQFGRYHYPKMVAADANDGMEYPMITMDGGRSPGYTGLLVHEIGHNWYYGMVGNNETYRASLDEGFTQFLTAEGMIGIDGDTLVEAPAANKYARIFAERKLTKDARVYNGYIMDAATGKDHQLNTHSDDFNGALGHDGGYRLVYYKTATMLYNLQYVLGDSLFSAAMLHYFNQWKFAHPYFEDFRNSVIQFTHVDLNWFFDQWLETTKDLDYAVGCIKKVRNSDSADITFIRKGEMQMPLDFTVTMKDGTRQDFYIPNTWFEKNTGAVVLPRWIGWGKLNRTYKARIAAPSGIQKVTIDTTQRLADRMMLDNTRRRGLWPFRGNIVIRPDAGLNTPFDWKHYRFSLRPDIWYNAVDGIKAGLHFDGGFMNTFFRIEGTVWGNTHLGQWKRYKEAGGAYSDYSPVNFTLLLESPLSRRLPQLKGSFRARLLDGLRYHSAGISWQIDNSDGLSVQVQDMRRKGINTDYLLYPEEWSSNVQGTNTSLNIGYNHSYAYPGGAGYFTLSARAPLLTNTFNYSYVQMESINNRWIGRLLLRSRVFARYGTGNNIPYESALFLAGASPEEMMEDKYVRSMAFIPDSWVSSYSPYETGHFHYGGGLNLRGYAGYYAFDGRAGAELVAYKGRSGAAANIEADITNYIRWQPAITKNWLRLNLYAFADAGIMELNYFKTDASGNKVYTAITPAEKIADLRIDAGIGAAATIKKWGPLEKAKPLTLRFDMPLFLNRPPYGGPQYFGARWVLGVSRAF